MILKLWLLPKEREPTTPKPKHQPTAAKKAQSHTLVDEIMSILSALCYPAVLLGQNAPVSMQYLA
jgi:hypothetical protein